jgi:signal transduction histidine kinase
MNKLGATYLAPLITNAELLGWFYLSPPAATTASPAQLEQELAQTALLVGSALESIQQKTADPLQVPEDNPPPEEEPPRAEASKQTKTPPSEEDSRQFWVDLAASMSHEIRNPLVAIQTFAQLLPDRYDDDDFRKEFSNLVTGEIGKLNQLVEMINDFAHPPEPVYAQTALGEILEAAVSEAKRQTRRRLTIPIDLPDHLPDLPVNRPALQETIRHLVVNAIESVRERKTPRVRIRVTPPESNAAEYVTIEISDNGGGIPVEAQPRLYSPFYTTKPRGFGLGLPIARRTMQEHHGHLSVSSSEQGTAIRLALPIHPPSTPIEPRDPAKVSTHEKTPDR